MIGVCGRLGDARVYRECDSELCVKKVRSDLRVHMRLRVQCAH